MEDKDRNLNDQTIHLVSRARDGDHGAIEALFRLYEKPILNYVQRAMGWKLKAREEAADLVQSVWGDVLADIGIFEYRGSKSFLRWLKLRLERKIRDRGRKWAAQKRDVEKEVRIGQDDTITPGAPPPVDPDPTPSRVAIASERHRKLLALVQILSPDQRKAVVLHIWGEMSFESIGRELGRTAGAARQLYNRAMKKLNESYGSTPTATR